MEKTENKLKINKEIKRHKSAIIPPSPTVENNLALKDYSDNGSNNTNTNSTTCEGLFKIKSNSLFAFQEFDKFSFFCDNELRNDKAFQGDKKQNNINNTNEEINKDELNNTSSSYSLKEFNEDFLGNNNDKKRKSAFDSMPPYFAKYLCQNYQNNEEMPNIEQTNNNIFNNIINNQFASDIRRNNTQKQAKNFINPFFDHFKNNQEQINLENRRRSQGFVPPIYNYGGFNPNFNVMNNNLKNFFYINKVYNRSGGKSDNFQGENLNGSNNNININNSSEKRDFPDTINEYPDNYRKKSNTISIKPNQLFNPKNPIKMKNPYINNNNNAFSFNSSQNNTKNPKLLNTNIFNNNNYNILYIFQDQSNCRNIQEQLEIHKNDKIYIYNFFEQIKQDLISIIEHQFGNYVIQKLLEIIIYQENKQLINEFIKILNTNDLLYEICINNYGTRVIQKTLEKLVDNNYSRIETPELNNTINKLIAKHLYDLCCDKNGNHVYQKLLKVFYFEKEKNDFLYNYLSDISLDVAFLQQGATIYSTALSLANSKQKEKICIKIIDNIDKLINDKYGNYSVQAIINKLGNENNLIEPLYLYISNNIVNLSKQKCSSNVIDTFIMKKDDYSKKLVNDMIEKNIIKDIVKDQFGNYVVQKAMNISDKETLNKIINQIKPVVPELLESNIGRKIYDKLSEQYKNLFDND